MKIFLIVLCLCGIVLSACKKTNKTEEPPSKVNLLQEENVIEKERLSLLLITFAKQGKVQPVRELIDKGANVNTKKMIKEFSAAGHADTTKGPLPFVVYNFYECSILNIVLKEQKDIKAEINKLQKEILSERLTNRLMELEQKEKNIAEIIEILKKAGAKDSKEFIRKEVKK